ncbi:MULTISPECIES: hypothetical protein [Cylindrospermopsis]|jgi:hypothetical protein|uniref:Uncharacterized protein n=2 Tax=Cylindrospermopsis TaxID=77021 RepID=A0A7H0F4G8_9CYAN|nr:MULTISPECIES: hypothetical protein [Cylindrospermopsis]EFA68328.1 hypothetical protein CRC_03150 [Cylindrospermopsis raciborskii CS-505]OBU76233.1 hypothetical protein A9P98_07790 [Cylindrospermopsis raciborskii CS-505]QNP30934.1 hypothetical protein IAR63_08135 [Cylindrospermopsis curvispora GIHE-G1]TPX29162.1 hypothetical protein FIV49_01720 [Cylindrospermopsis raciborskii GIHE 2018]UJS04760.1 hypothetical protein L3I90_00330 [Cylindrospermopsis raciborskii KLL07]
MTIFEPRAFAKPVYQALTELSSNANNNTERLQEQKNQAIELYTYLATWGLMRLKAEEKALSQDDKRHVVQKFFECLESLSGEPNLARDAGLTSLTNLSPEKYLGLTGLGLSLAQEFSFWAAAVYHNV